MQLGWDVTVCAQFQEKKNVSNVREIYSNRECANIQEKSFQQVFFFFNFVELQF